MFELLDWHLHFHYISFWQGTGNTADDFGQNTQLYVFDFMSLGSFGGLRIHTVATFCGSLWIPKF